MAGYWPNAGTPGKQLKDMYERIRAAELKAAQEAKAGVEDKGAISGVVRKAHASTNGPAGSI